MGRHTNPSAHSSHLDLCAIPNFPAPVLPVACPVGLGAAPDATNNTRMAREAGSQTCATVRMRSRRCDSEPNEAVDPVPPAASVVDDMPWHAPPACNVGAVCLDARAEVRVDSSIRPRHRCCEDAGVSASPPRHSAYSRASDDQDILEHALHRGGVLGAANLI